MITGRLRQQQPPPPPPPQAQQPQFQMPRTPQEAQALFESLLAAGQIPQEIVDRMQKGERFALRVTPQGLVLQSAGAPPAPAATQQPVDGGAAPGDASQSAEAPPAAEAPAAPAPTPAPAPAPAPRPAPQPPMAGPMRPAAPARPTGQPKPGRNDDCPCGSGIKYKKCCAPAFD
jgi:hypothetical protein